MKRLPQKNEVPCHLGEESSQPKQRLVEFRTKKAAREAGLRTEHEWFLHFPSMLPTHNAKPVMVKDEPFFTSEECEEVLSRTAARQRGLSIPRGAAPCGERCYRYYRGVMYYDVYRISDCVPKRHVTPRLPEEIDLLQAIFIVNRSAKRYRDAATSQYLEGNHGFAAVAKETKERLYELKERGLAIAYFQKRIHFAGIHGRLGMYRGEGYCYHSPMIPMDTCADVGSDGCEFVYVEACPKDKDEGRLKDAEHTLQALPDRTGEFDLLDFPVRASRQADLSWRDICHKW